MRDPETGDDSLDPAIDCIIALEEQRLGRCLNTREINALVQRFTRDQQGNDSSSVRLDTTSEDPPARNPIR
jgi:hypothetical protein